MDFTRVQRIGGFKWFHGNHGLGKPAWAGGMFVENGNKISRIWKPAWAGGMFVENLCLLSYRPPAPLLIKAMLST